MKPSGQYHFNCRSMSRFFRDDPIRTFLLLSLVAHLLFLVSWPGPRAGRYQDMDRIAILLVHPQSTPHRARKATPAKKIIHRKKTTVTKKKRIITEKKPVLKKTAIRKIRPAARKKKADLSKIRQKLAKEEQEKTVNLIKTRLAQNKTANKPVAISAVGNYQLNRYAEQLKSRITEKWKLPELLLKEKLSATIAITIDAAGRIVSQQPEKMSGNQLFDDSIIKAITRAAPFPPFPQAMDKSQEEFVITFDPNDIQ